MANGISLILLIRCKNVLIAISPTVNAAKSLKYKKVYQQSEYLDNVLIKINH